MRLQKYLSNEGECSRRKAEEWIDKGWVSINDEVVTEVGRTINPEIDKVQIAKAAKQEQTKWVTIAFYKPKGIVTNCPQKDEKEIKSLLPKAFQSVSSIGRLDKDSEGLILLTNNGQVAKHYLDPKTPHERIYEVTLKAPLTPKQHQKLESGLRLFGSKTKPLKCDHLSDTTYLLTMTEGKNRQIRRMMKKIGHDTTKLKRIQFGPIELGDLKPGKFRTI